MFLETYFPNTQFDLECLIESEMLYSSKNFMIAQRFKKIAESRLRQKNNKNYSKFSANEINLLEPISPSRESVPIRDYLFIVRCSTVAKLFILLRPIQKLARCIVQKSSRRKKELMVFQCQGVHIVGAIAKSKESLIISIFCTFQLFS